MSIVKKTIKIVLIIVLLGGILGGLYYFKVSSRFKNLDVNYTENFSDFSNIKADLKGKNLLIHIKTGFNVDDAQGCVAFNIAYAAFQSGINTSVLIDASATSLFKDQKLAEYPLPERMRKTLALQSKVKLESLPKTYKSFVEYLNKRGVKFYMNGSMNIVSGNRQRVYQTFEGYEFIKPLSTMEMLDKIMKADKYITY